MNIIISAGGSGGHIYPALSIINEFKKRENHLNILYIGTHNRMEKEIVPKENIPYEAIEIYGFTKDMKRNVKNIFLIRKAIKKCKSLMQNFKPDIVIGVGGYVTYPVLKAAHQLHIKTFIHEQNSRPGKVNYLVSSYADIVGVTFKSSMQYFKKAKKVIYTGHPALDETKNIKEIDKSMLGFSKDKKLVIFVAGSLGSTSLNQKMLDFLNSNLHEDYEILYILGNNINLEEFNKQVKNKSGLKVVSYFENLTGIMASSDLVISRAGAGVLFEIIGLEKPSIIIPSPNVANNHQYFNALELQEKGVIQMIQEKDLTKENLAEMIHTLLNNSQKINTLKENMQNYKQIDPNTMIYKTVKELIDSSK